MATDERKDGKDRKERVLHTRVPASLEVEIKRVADALRVPVSNLVRQILEDSVHFVSQVGETVHEVRSEVERDRALLGDRWGHYRKLFQRLGATRRRPGVFGWQPLIMNLRGQCSACGVDLTSGAGAFVGLSDDPAEHPFRCERCVPRAETPPGDGQEEDGP
ncbi:MAG: hypothetical protein AABZ30_01760 [Myxococcota bacterium]